MKLYDAIRQMRELTARNEPFSFSYMSHNPSAGRSDGVVDVRRALLRKRSKSRMRGEYLLSYYDVSANEDRQFYFPLLLSFNNQHITHDN